MIATQDTLFPLADLKVRGYATPELCIDETETGTGDAADGGDDQ